MRFPEMDPETGKKKKTHQKQQVENLVKPQLGLWFGNGIIRLPIS